MGSMDAAEIDPVVDFPFRIDRDDRVATAGSCFAQHLGSRLSAARLHLLITEKPHPILPSDAARELGYGVCTARFGNIYTARQLLQLFRRAFGHFEPAEEPWSGSDGRLYDPFRPTVQPRGFATRREFDVDRSNHLAAVRRMFATADIFIFTLGLTECWTSKADGAVFPLCPGVAGGKFDPERYAFVNLQVGDVVDDLRTFYREVKEINPGLRLVLTVSPVPLAATAETKHVWTATAYSKSVLRVAAEALTQYADVAYFPAYEIITSPAARGAYFDDDLRTVTDAGVNHVMRLFFRHATNSGNTASPDQAPNDRYMLNAIAAVAQICDEVRLDP
jgi:hypothetical protein